jgi:hypothetical protein
MQLGSNATVKEDRPKFHPSEIFRFYKLAAVQAKMASMVAQQIRNPTTTSKANACKGLLLIVSGFAERERSPISRRVSISTRSDGNPEPPNRRATPVNDMFFKDRRAGSAPVEARRDHITSENRTCEEWEKQDLL